MTFYVLVCMKQIVYTCSLLGLPSPVMRLLVSVRQAKLEIPFMAFLLGYINIPFSYKFIMSFAGVLSQQLGRILQHRQLKNNDTQQEQSPTMYLTLHRFVPTA